MVSSDTQYVARGTRPQRYCIVDATPFTPYKAEHVFCSSNRATRKDTCWRELRQLEVSPAVVTAFQRDLVARDFRCWHCETLGETVTLNPLVMNPREVHNGGVPKVVASCNECRRLHYLEVASSAT